MKMLGKFDFWRVAYLIDVRDLAGKGGTLRYVSARNVNVDGPDEDEFDEAWRRGLPAQGRTGIRAGKREDPHD